MQAHWSPTSKIYCRVWSTSKLMSAYSGSSSWTFSTKFFANECFLICTSIDWRKMTDMSFISNLFHDYCKKKLHNFTKFLYLFHTVYPSRFLPLFIEDLSSIYFITSVNFLFVLCASTQICSMYCLSMSAFDTSVPLKLPIKSRKVLLLPTIECKASENVCDNPGFILDLPNPLQPFLPVLSFWINDKNWAWLSTLPCTYFEWKPNTWLCSIAYILVCRLSIY